MLFVLSGRSACATIAPDSSGTLADSGGPLPTSLHDRVLVVLALEAGEQLEQFETWLRSNGWVTHRSRWVQTFDNDPAAQQETEVVLELADHFGLRVEGDKIRLKPRR